MKDNYKDIILLRMANQVRIKMEEKGFDIDTRVEVSRILEEVHKDLMNGNSDYVN